MTDNTNEDKEVARISDIAMMHGFMTRAVHAEAERDRLKYALERIAKGVANGPRCHAIARAALGKTEND
jgi:hypothetical protein